jgi:4-amino-4-deoxy-L-arabinose transferase-like glycosyltransferase
MTDLFQPRKDFPYSSAFGAGFNLPLRLRRYSPDDECLQAPMRRGDGTGGRRLRGVHVAVAEVGESVKHRMDTCSRNVEEYARLGGTDIADRAGARWADIALVLAGMVLLFWGLGGRSLWAAEGRWAQVTREMFQTRDFFHPTIGGMPYFDKPLLTYWLRAAIVAVTGRLDELVIRLPSAVAGLAAIWATVRIGARLWSARTGKVAGWLLLTTYSFLFWSRTGTAEAENLAAITLAVAWYWSKRDRLGFSALLVFYLIALVGALTKGLTAVVKSRKQLDRPSRWLLWAILLVFLFFTLSGSRRSYYILPILPLCALQMAVFVNWVRGPLVEEYRRQGLHMQKVLTVGLIAFELAVPLILLIPMALIGFHAPMWLNVASLTIGVAAALAGAIAMRLFVRSTESDGGRGGLWPSIAVAAVVLGGYFGWQQKILEVNRTQRPFVGWLHAVIAGCSLVRVASFPKHNADMLFYLDSDKSVEALEDPNQVRAFMEESGPAALIMQQRYMTALPTEVVARLDRQQSLHEVTQPWESKSAKKDKWVAWFFRIPTDVNGVMVAGEGAANAK